MNEINASLQKLLRENEECDDDIGDDMDGQHDPYVSAMLRRQHKKLSHNALMLFYDGSFQIMLRNFIFSDPLLLFQTTNLGKNSNFSITIN